MKDLFKSKKGHFTGDTVVISVIAAMVAYFVVEKVITKHRVQHEEKNTLRFRK